MREVPLQNTPNQELETIINSTVFNIRLHTIKQMTVADVYINRVLICAGVRCVPDVPLIPLPYVGRRYGNFVFSCLDANYPYYELFGASQRLVYLLPGEIAEARATRAIEG